MEYYNSLMWLVKLPSTCYMKYCGGNKRAETKRQAAKETRALLRIASRQEAGFKIEQEFDQAPVEDHPQNAEKRKKSEPKAGALAHKETRTSLKTEHRKKVRQDDANVKKHALESQHAAGVFSPQDPVENHFKFGHQDKVSYVCVCPQPFERERAQERAHKRQ